MSDVNPNIKITIDDSEARAALQRLVQNALDLSRQAQAELAAGIESDAVTKTPGNDEATLRQFQEEARQLGAGIADLQPIVERLVQGFSKVNEVVQQISENARMTAGFVSALELNPDTAASRLSEMESQARRTALESGLRLDSETIPGDKASSTLNAAALSQAVKQEILAREDGVKTLADSKATSQQLNTAVKQELAAREGAAEASIQEALDKKVAAADEKAQVTQRLAANEAYIQSLVEAKLANQKVIEQTNQEANLQSGYSPGGVSGSLLNSVRRQFGVGGAGAALGGFAGATGGILGAQVLFGGVQVIQNSISEALNFEEQLKLVKATLDDIGQTQSFVTIKNQLIDLSNRTAFAASELVPVYLQAQGAFGLGGGAVATDQAAVLGRISGQTPDTALKQLITIGKDYGLSVSELHSISDAAFGAFERYGAPIASTTSALQILAESADAAGLKMSFATDLIAKASTISGLAPTQEAERLARVLNEIPDKTGALLVLAETIPKLKEALTPSALDAGAGGILQAVGQAGLSGTEQQQVAVALGGARGAPATLAAIQGAADAAANAAAQTGDAGKAAKAFADQMSSAKEQFHQIVLEVQNIAIAIANSGLLSGIEDVLKVVKDLLSGFQAINNALGDMPAKIAGVGLALKGVSLIPGLSALGPGALLGAGGGGLSAGVSTIGQTEVGIGAGAVGADGLLSAIGGTAGVAALTALIIPVVIAGLVAAGVKGLDTTRNNATGGFLENNVTGFSGTQKANINSQATGIVAGLSQSDLEKVANGDFSPVASNQAVKDKAIDNLLTSGKRQITRSDIRLSDEQTAAQQRLGQQYLGDTSQVQSDTSFVNALESTGKITTDQTKKDLAGISAGDFKVIQAIRALQNKYKDDPGVQAALKQYQADAQANAQLASLANNETDLSDIQANYDAGLVSASDYAKALKDDLASISKIMTQGNLDKTARDALIKQYASDTAALKQLSQAAYQNFTDFNTLQSDLETESGVAPSQVSQDSIARLTNELNSGQITDPQERYKLAQDIVKAAQATLQEEIKAAGDAQTALKLANDGIQIPQDARVAIIYEEITQLDSNWQQFLNTISNGVPAVADQLATIVAKDLAQGMTNVQAVEDAINQLNAQLSADYLAALAAAAAASGGSGGGAFGLPSIGAGGVQSGPPSAGGTVNSGSGPLGPKPSVVTSGFGADRGNHFHAGVDLAANVGTPVYSVVSGTVVQASDTDPKGYGNEVVVQDSSGRRFVYAHLSGFDVQQGQTVSAGSQLGLSGGAPGAPGSGDATGPHLHFEVDQNGKPIDPSGYLNTGINPVPGTPVLPPNTVTSTADAQQAAQQVAAEQADLAKAKLDYAKALAHDNPVESAKDAKAAAAADFQAAAAETDSIKRAADEWRAFAADVRANDALAKAIQDITQAQFSYVEALAKATGDNVAAAQAAFDAAQQQVQFLKQNFPGNTAEITNAEAAAVTAGAALRDANLNYQEKQIDFNLAVHNITVGQAVAQLNAILSQAGALHLTQDEIEQIQQKIYQLTHSGQAQFNLPTTLGLPTLYEARRVVQTPGGAGNYNDQRNVQVVVYVTNGMSTGQVVQALSDAMDNTNRVVGAGPRMY